MFYASEILSRKGPLSHVWMAAHMERRLSKTQIVNTRIPDAVADILNPTDKLALRLSSHLMLGVVKIYQRKAQYLLQESNDAVYRIKTAFRQGEVDLPLEQRMAQYSNITMTGTDGGVDLAVLLRLQAPVTSAQAPPTMLRDRSSILSSLKPSPVEQQRHRQPEQQRERMSLASGAFGFADFDTSILPLGSEHSIEVGRDISLLSETGFAMPLLPDLDKGTAEEHPPADYDMFDPRYHSGPMDYDKPPMTPPRDTEIPMLTEMTPLAKDAQIPTLAPPTPTPRKRKAAAVTVDSEIRLEKATYRGWLDDQSDLLRPAPSASSLVVEEPSTRQQYPAGWSWLETSVLSPEAGYFKRRARPMFAREHVVEEAAAEEGVPQLPPPLEHLSVEVGRDTDITPSVQPHQPGAPAVLEEEYDYRFSADGGRFGEVPFGGHEYSFDQPSPKRKAEGPIEDRETAPTTERVPEDIEEDERAQTEKIATYLRNQFQRANKLSTFDLLHNKTRRPAAGLFYEILVLKSQARIQVEQEEPYSDIGITATERL